MQTGKADPSDERADQSKAPATPIRSKAQQANKAGPSSCLEENVPIATSLQFRIPNLAHWPSQTRALVPSRETWLIGPADTSGQQPRLAHKRYETHSSQHIPKPPVSQTNYRWQPRTNRGASTSSNVILEFAGEGPNQRL